VITGLSRFGLPVDVRGATDRPPLRTPFGDWLDDGLVPADAAAAEE